MGRIRYIKPDFFSDTRISDVTANYPVHNPTFPLGSRRFALPVLRGCGHPEKALIVVTKGDL